MEVKTNFLAEDWLDFLIKEVKPTFPEVEFSTYVPEELEFKWRVPSPRVLVIFPEKSAFIYNLKGIPLTERAVMNSLKRYVYKTTNKLLTER